MNTNTAIPTPDQYPAPIGPKNDVLTRVQAHIERFVAFNNPHHSFVLSLWALHTWVFDAAAETPYIYVSSIDPGSGKSTLMATMGDVARSAEVQAGVTAASIYRSLIEETPTFIIDEVDAIYTGAKNETLRRVLNSGYQYTGAERVFIDGESQRLPTFCPKMLGGLDNGQVPATVLDRSIRIRLRKLDVDGLAAANVELRSMKRLRKDGSIESLQAALKNWATVDVISQLDDMDLTPTEGISARQWQISMPLIEIARLFGREDEARSSLVAVFVGESSESPEAAALRKIRDLFDETGARRLPVTDMAEATDYPVKTLGRMLSRFDVKSKPMKIGGDTVRGYERVELNDLFDRMID